MYLTDYLMLFYQYKIYQILLNNHINFIFLTYNKIVYQLK